MNDEVTSTRRSLQWHTDGRMMPAVSEEPSDGCTDHSCDDDRTANTLLALDVIAMSVAGLFGAGVVIAMCVLMIWFCS